MSDSSAARASVDPHVLRTVEQLRELIGVPKPPVVREVIVGSTIDAMARNFIAASPFLLLATADAAGGVDISPKGDPAGFVHVQDETTLLIPDRAGNKLAIGHCNLLQNPELALLFLIPGTGETLRVTGSAELTREPALLERLSVRGKPALLVIRVRVREVFFHCPRALMRSELWHPAGWPQPHPISVGRFLASRLRQGDGFAAAVDEAFRSEGI
jgi:uncharacterized protein